MAWRKSATNRLASSGLSDRRAYRPLLVEVDPLEQVELIGWHSCWQCDPLLGQRFSQPAWRTNQPRGEWRLGQVSHNLRQFALGRPPVGFNEFDDERIYIHHAIIAAGDEWVNSIRGHPPTARPTGGSRGEAGGG